MIAAEWRNGLLSDEARESVRDLFEAHFPEEHSQRVHFHVGHVAAIRDCMWTTPTLNRTLDALHFAAAIEVGAGLVTFDSRLAVSARALEVTVVDMAEDSRNPRSGRLTPHQRWGGEERV
jgi:hypothetical protein